ncbi:hypothetical protein BURC_01175 [Burkholderiaceae bacterium]|nr:hypothetical protein BURC_01175 [Burkholderiaceae bacterium]
MQTAIVTLIVLACGVYAGWTLMPQAARRAIAAQLLKLPLPARLAQTFVKASAPAGGCGACGGCPNAPASPPGEKAIRVHRQPSR